MSTMCLDRSAFQQVANTLVAIAYSENKTSAYSSASDLGYEVYGAKARDMTREEVILRAFNILMALNTRAYTIAYAHTIETGRKPENVHNDAWSKAQPRLTSAVKRSDLQLSRKNVVSSYKKFQCIQYNLDKYGNNECVAKICKLIENVLTSQIIEESNDYKTAEWG